MDLSKFKTSDWLKVGGGAVMLIAGFLTWWQPSCPSGSGPECDAAIDSLGLDVTAFDLTFTGLFPWLFIVAIAVLTVLTVTGTFKPSASLPVPLILVGVSALSFLLVLIRFFADPFDSALGIGGDTERGIGLYLALLATAAVTAGCVMGFKESGGDLSDLKDINKMKGQFGGASNAGGTPPPPPGMTPPPPPPGMSPPPPPPAG